MYGLSVPPRGWVNESVLWRGQLPPVAFDPPAGSYSGAQQVSLSCPAAGAVIRYTLDGSAPTVSSPVYSGPVTVSASATLRAAAFASQWSSSPDDGGDGYVIASSSGGSGGSGVEPTSASTGPRIAATTTITGDYTLAANQAISGYHITGVLYMNGAGCSATDTTADGGVAVNQRPGGNYNNPANGGMKLAYCAMSSLASIGTAGIEVDHCRIIATAKGTPIVWGMVPGSNTASGVNMHDCYCQGLVSIGSGSGYHLEEMHLEGLTGSTFTNNRFECDVPDQATAGEMTAALNFSQDFGPPSDNVYDGNWIYGGGPFQLYPFMGPGVVYKNNRFYSYNTYPGGPRDTPSVYSKSLFVAGGTNMSAWVDPTSATVFNNYADDQPWDLLSAILA